MNSALFRSIFYKIAFLSLILPSQQEQTSLPPWWIFYNAGKKTSDQNNSSINTDDNSNIADISMVS